MGRVREAPERTRRVCRRVARSDSCGSTEEKAGGAKQPAPTAEGCSAQTATADRCASSKETADPRFHRGAEAGRHRGAIRAVSAYAEVAVQSLARSTATRTFFALRLGTGSCRPIASNVSSARPPPRARTARWLPERGRYRGARDQRCDGGVRQKLATRVDRAHASERRNALLHLKVVRHLDQNLPQDRLCSLRRAP